MNEQKRNHLKNIGELVADQSDLNLQIAVAFGEGLSATNAIRKAEEAESQ